MKDSNEKVATIAVPQPQAQVEVKRSSLSDMAVQTSTAGMEDVGTDVEFEFDDSTCQVDDNEGEQEEDETEQEEEDDIDFDADEYDAYLMEDEDYTMSADKHQVRRASLNIVNRGSGRRKSVSLNDIFGNSYIHEAASGERIIISRGWPTATTKSASKTTKSNTSTSSKIASKINKPSSSSSKTTSIMHNAQQQRRQSYSHNHQPALSGLVKVVTSNGVDSATSTRRRSISEISIKQVIERRRRKHQQLNEEQKRSLLVEFLKTQAANEGAKLLAQHRILPPQPPVKVGLTKTPGRILVNKNGGNSDAINENTFVEQAGIKIKTSMPVVKVDSHQSNNNLSSPNQVGIKQRQASNNKVSALKQQVGETTTATATNHSDKERLVKRIDSQQTRPSLLQSQDINEGRVITSSVRNEKTLKKPLVVQYDLPVHEGKPIALGSSVNF